MSNDVLKLCFKCGAPAKATEGGYMWITRSVTCSDTKCSICSMLFTEEDWNTRSSNGEMGEVARLGLQLTALQDVYRDLAFEHNRILGALNFICGCEDLKSARQAALQASVCTKKSLTSSPQNGEYYFVLRGVKHYCGGPIHGIDVRCKLPPECCDYSIGIVDGQKVNYINDTTPVPSGSEVCAVPPCGFTR